MELAIGKVLAKRSSQTTLKRDDNAIQWKHVKYNDVKTWNLISAFGQKKNHGSKNHQVLFCSSTMFNRFGVTDS